MSITIKIGNNKGTKEIPRKFALSATIMQVKVAYQNLVNDKIPAERMTFKRGKTKLNNDATIGSKMSKISKRKGVFFLMLTSRVDGGAQMGKGKQSARKIPSEYAVKNRSCIIFKEKCTVARMPCGHYISADGLAGHIKLTLTRNDYEYEIHCPEQKCNKEWDFDTCCDIADLSIQEYEEYDTLVTSRQMPDTKGCPHCDVLCERPTDMREHKVRCLNCKKAMWCFLCENLWKSSGNMLCGNEDCPTYIIQLTLTECLEKKVGSVVCPETRACPQCHSLNDHIDNCKHVHCYTCGYEFCFICLRVWKGGCGSGCKVHPRQSLM